MKQNEIIASGYKIKIQSPSGMDKRQSFYNEIMPVFKHAISSLHEYQDLYPLNPKDRDAYMRQSRVCRRKITELQTKFIDGIVNLNEASLPNFRFLIVRELRDLLNETYMTLKIKFSYQRLLQHFHATVLKPIFWNIQTIIPEDEYYSYNHKFPQRRVPWMR
jgi:hypothetical protein